MEPAEAVRHRWASGWTTSASRTNVPKREKIMKRNMDVIRLLLLQLEGSAKATEDLKKYDEPTVVYNAACL
jgi:hypothetical protein